MSQKFKKIIALALAAACLLTLVACTDNGSGDDEKKFKVAYIMPGPSAYFAPMNKGADKAAEDYGIELVHFESGWDTTTQAAQIEDACTSGEYDLIMVNGVDSMAIISSIEYCNENNVPIMTIGNGVGEKTGVTYEGSVSWVGENETKTGGLAGEIALRLLGSQGGNIVMIEGKSGTFCQIHRREGMMNVLDAADNVNVIYTKAADWDKDKAMQIAEDVLQSNMDVDMFLCQDDTMAAGVGQVVSEYGKKDQIKIVGVGGSIQGLEAMREGLIDGTTFLSAYDEGYLCVETAAKYLNGEKYDTYVEMQQVEVTKENIDKFKGEW